MPWLIEVTSQMNFANFRERRGSGKDHFHTDCETLSSAVGKGSLLPLALIQVSTGRPNLLQAGVNRPSQLRKSIARQCVTACVSHRSLEPHSQPRGEISTTERCDFECSAVQVLFNPLLLERDL